MPVAELIRQVGITEQTLAAHPFSHKTRELNG